jgi:uncharacterized membrane protein HdeD (DUF308 family)
LAGVVLGLFMLTWGIGSKTSYIVSAILLVLWEVFEMIADIREHKENRSADILVGFFGFIISYTYFPSLTSNFLMYFLVIGFVFLLSSAIGWSRYFKYRG